MSAEQIDMASKIRGAMIDCLEERDGRYYATEAGCVRLREILFGHGIHAVVGIGADGRFQIGPIAAFVHTCHWPNCGKEVPAAMWGCKRHWFKLPLSLRNRIWATYRPGQEEDKRPSDAYIAAARAVQDWIASQSKEGQRDP